MELEQVLQLFSHEHTAEMHDRQVSALSRMLGGLSNGFKYRQLQSVCQLLDLVWAKADAGHKEFDRPLIQLIETCSKPVVREKSNEEFTGGLAGFESMVLALEKFLFSPRQAIQLAAARTLREVALGKDTLRSNVATTMHVLGAGEVKADLRPLPQEVNQQALLKAGIVKSVVALLEKQVQQLGCSCIAENGLIRTGRLHDAIDLGYDEDEDAENGGLGEGRGGEERIVRSTVLRAETVSGLGGKERSLLMELSQLLRELSASGKNAASLVREGGMACMLSLLRVLVDEPRDPLIQVCVEVLWNCLEHSQNILESGPAASSRSELVDRRRKGNAMYALASEEALLVIKDLFEALLTKGHKARDKELRNEVLVVASFIARQQRSHTAFRTTGLLDLLLTYATAGETETQTKADPHMFATVLPPDIELKRLLWALLSDLAREDKENMRIIAEESALIDTLVMYMDIDVHVSTASAQLHPLHTAAVETSVVDPPLPPPQHHSQASQSPRSSRPFHATFGSGAPAVIARLPRTSLRVLQQQAMAVLLNLAPRAPDRFKTLAGHHVTLRFLEVCSKSLESRSLVQGALMLLLSFVGLPGLQDELGEMDAVRIMLARFNDETAPTSLRADAVCILSRLCARHVANQAAFRQADGVMALVGQIENYSRARQPAPRAQPDAVPSSALGMSGSATEKVSSFIVGVVDCLWNAVIGNSKSEARFLAHGGLEALLGLLEVCPVLMRHQVVGVLSDLCENAGMIPTLQAWRSDRTMLTSAELLMHVFEDEEVRLGFHRGSGVIQNLWEPLRSHHAPVATGPPVVGNMGFGGGSGGASVGSDGASPAAFARLNKALQQSASHKAERGLRRAVDVLDLRAKVASVVAYMGFDWVAEALPAPERATLLMCKHYSAFRAGESWMQVRRELRNDGVKPIAADSFLLEIKLEEVFNTAREVKCEQMELAEESKVEARDKEKAFFDTILQQRDQEIKQLLIKRSVMGPRATAQLRKSSDKDQAKHTDAHRENSAAHGGVESEESSMTSSFAPLGNATQTQAPNLSLKLNLSSATATS